MLQKIIFPLDELTFGLNLTFQRCFQVQCKTINTEHNHLYMRLHVNVKAFREIIYF